jgi:tetratricopeptide (TPR) repeat protein
MFEFGRELRRLFGADNLNAPRDGMTGGDASLLELLDLRLLQQEAKAGDVAAGRIGAKDRAQRKLEAAIIWREVARRSGDPAALRKAAAIAEGAADLFDRDRRPDGWARARCEQAFCALLGAELFGDDGLNAAAGIAFRDAHGAARGGMARPLAEIGLLVIEGRARMGDGDAQLGRITAARFDTPIAGLKALTRRCRAARLLIVEARLLRADILLGWGARLGDRDLLQQALDEIETAGADLALDYEPLSYTRAAAMRGQALALLGEMTGQIESVIEGVNALAAVLDDLSRDHSPLDWARTQTALAQALQALGEATTSERAYEQAVTCYDRAVLVLRDVPALAIRAVAASNRALCLARSAELSGDLAVLDAAEAAFRIELSTMSAGRDPTAWALLQVNLARLYEARVEITGRDRGERAAAATALSAALEVFSEQGLRSLSLVASDALERLSQGPTSRARPAI